MLRFFKTIRKKLVVENRFSKYLLYAVGELILVIAGILIALQINNSNQAYKSEKETELFLTRLRVEVNQNKKLAQDELSEEIDQFTSSKRILDLISMAPNENKESELDSLLVYALTSNSVQIKMGTLNEGLNMGLVGRIKDDSLKRKLYNFPDLIEDIRLMESIESNSIENNLMPYLLKKYNFRRMDNTFFKQIGYFEIGESKFKDKDYMEVLNDKQFESMIDVRIMNNAYAYKRYTELIQEIESIDSLIGQFLNSRR